MPLSIVSSLPSSETAGGRGGGGDGERRREVKGGEKKGGKKGGEEERKTRKALIRLQLSPSSSFVQPAFSKWRCTTLPSSPYLPLFFDLLLSEVPSLCITQAVLLRVPMAACLRFNCILPALVGKTTTAQHPSVPLSSCDSGASMGFLLPSDLSSSVSSSDSPSTTGPLQLEVLGLLALYPLPFRNPGSLTLYPMFYRASRNLPLPHSSYPTHYPIL